MSNKVSEQVWERSPQSGSKLLILLSLADRADLDGFCWPSHTDTAKRARVQRTYALKLINELVQIDGELLEKKRRGTSSLYIVPHGRSKEDLLQILQKRFKLKEEEAQGHLSKLLTCLESAGHLSKILTGDVNSTRHEPSLTITNNHQEIKDKNQEQEPESGGEVVELTWAEAFEQRWEVELPAVFDHALFYAKWDKWEKTRKKMGKPLISTTVESQIRFLLKQPEDALEILENSIRSTWQGLFPLKGKRQGTSKVSTNAERLKRVAGGGHGS